MQRENKQASKIAAQLSDPTHRFHPPGASHDDRRDVAAGKAPQRLRARQTEPRVAEQCHVRKPRHP
jgi:hypothetical protein